MKLSSQLTAAALAAVMAVSVLTACGGSYYPGIPDWVTSGSSSSSSTSSPASSKPSSGKPASSSSSSSAASSSKPASSVSSSTPASSEKPASSAPEKVTTPWKYFVLDRQAKTAELTGYDASHPDAPKGNVVIPSSVDGYKIVEIDQSAFQEDNSITSVVIPSTVETIDYYAFRGCKNLKTVVMQEYGSATGVRTIEGWAFAGCDHLTNVQFASGLEYIAPLAFNACYALERVVIPENSNNKETVLEHCCFQACTALVHVYLPRSLKKMDYPFTFPAADKVIYYQGSEEEWNRIEGVDDKMKIVGDGRANVTVYYNCTPDAVTGA